jgi:hypothetical protein
MKRTRLDAAVDLARTRAGRSNGRLDRNHRSPAISATSVNRGPAALQDEHFDGLDSDLSLSLDPHWTSNPDQHLCC